MFDVDKLIKAVKARPPLYNKNDRFHHGHRKKKEKMWREVFQELEPNWSKMSPLDKAECGREIQRRWKSLRTCFTRELALQKKEKLRQDSDEPVKRRKRYEYFDALTFIADDNDANDEVINAEEQESDDDSADPIDSYQSKDVLNSFEESSISEDLSVHEIKIEKDVQNYQQPETIYNRSDTVRDSVRDVLKDIKKDEEDDDRQFMLSLIPSFRKIHARYKLEAKIEMLKVIQNFQGQE